jgi:hypothetical protein
MYVSSGTVLRSALRTLEWAHSAGNVDRWSGHHRDVLPSLRWASNGSDASGSLSFLLGSRLGFAVASREALVAGA